MEKIHIFYCCTDTDEDKKLRDRLDAHLIVLKRLELITLRLTRQISAGTNWRYEQDKRLQTADLILLLVSPDFIHSDYHYGIEMRHALEKHNAGNVWVLPIILRPTPMWEATPFGKLQALPKNGMAITMHANLDAAFVEVVKEISLVVARLLALRQELTSATKASERTFPKFTQVMGGPLCVSCGARNPLGITTCENCGDLLLEDTEIPVLHHKEKSETSAEQFCENCGDANSSTARFCQYCAAPFPFKHTTESLLDQALLRGRYRLESRIGQGGTGAVYEEIDTRFGNRLIAIKEMSHAGLSAANIREAEAAFEREVQILADLLHPNLPRIYDYFTESERSYLVMDFIEGQTLEDYLERANGKPLALDQVLEWGKQLCDVLDYLHTRQPPVIFRNLKPSNVMISGNGHVFLIDFGIALKSGQSHDTVPQGSPGFAAPEQYGKIQSSPRSDIYSLGALLHCLLTGRDPSTQPFSFCPVSQLNPMVPPDLEALLRQMVSMDADLRPVSIQEVIRVLLKIELLPVNNRYSQPLPAVSASQVGQGTTVNAQTASSGNPLLQEAYRLYTQHRLQEALDLYDRALQTERDNPLAWQGRALVQTKRGQHLDALSSFERALKLDPNLVISLNGKGTALNMLHRNKDALDAFDRAILLEKENVMVWNGKGAALSALGQPEQALTAFEVALHFDPRMVQAWNNKGLVLRQMSRYKDALRAFDEALALDPNVVSSWNGKGVVLNELKRQKESLQAYQEALKVDPRYPPALCGIGDIYYLQHKLKAACDQYEKALQSDPRYVKAWEKHAIVLADMGHYPKALESYDEALSLDPRYASAWNGKASLLCNMKQYQQALYAYNQALLHDTNSAQSWNGKGNVYYHLKDYRSALDAYERALRLNPRMVSALHNKSLVLRQLQRYEEALEAAESAILIAPDDPDNWMRKAETLKKLHRRREARDAENEVTRLGGIPTKWWMNIRLLRWGANVFFGLR